MQHETSILRHIFDNTEDAKKKKLGIPTRIPKLHAYGTAGGTPYILMQMKDGNLEKLREECEEERLRKNEKTKEKKSKEDGEKVQLIPPIDAFFIGQEAVIAMKECHSYSIVHRDIKPTNLILGVDDEKAWYLCDFGDACPIGDTKLLSPPDAFTLPYLSRTAHLAVRKPTKATISMDIESWFYVFIELFTELPWKGELDEESVLSAKKSFWESLGSERNLLSELPSEVMKISKIVANTSLENPYSALTAILRDGFKKENAKHSPWKPFWKEERPKTEAKPSAEEQKESVAVENKNKNSKANRSVSKG
uniref:non-specific serine/threonine protein kinase n=1 Tax=Caenorhabditis tropicalis TaxID=1561998 RepID=A0A1I7TEN2_9PELO